MENKTTVELLDLLWKEDKASEKGDKDGNFDWTKHGEICEELVERYPFSEILGVKEDRNSFTLEERIEGLEKDVKLLKRHKHDEKSGDVMTRI